jgi:hypothetical protein
MKRRAIFCMARGELHPDQLYCGRRKSQVFCMEPKYATRSTHHAQRQTVASLPFPHYNALQSVL